MSNLAIISGAGLAGLFAFKSKFPATLFSYHPTLLGIGWLALAPLAIKYVRESKETTDKKIKEVKTSTHAYVNVALQLCVAGGGYAIWKNKENMAASKGLVAKHLASTHGKLGALSTVLMLASGLLAAYYTSFSSKFGLNYLWRSKIHKWLGMLSYVTAGLTILNIVNAPWGKFSLGPQGQKAVSAAVIGINALVVAPFIKV